MMCLLILFFRCASLLKIELSTQYNPHHNTTHNISKMTDTKEQKTISNSLMLEMEMNDTNIESNSYVSYKQLFANMTPELLANTASLFKINRAREWASTVWELANVIITDTANKQFAKPLKEAIRFATDSNYTRFELKLPSLQVIFTDGFRQYEVIVPVSTKLGIVDSWIRANETDQIWFRKLLLTGDLLYYEVPSTMTQNFRQLSSGQILFDLYGPQQVYIFVKLKTANPIAKLFAEQEQSLIDEITHSNQKYKNEDRSKGLFTRKLREILPECLKVNEHRDPTLQIGRDGVISWDVLITNNSRSFKFDGQLFPNSMIAAIDIRPNITQEILKEFEKKFATVKNNTVLQCLVVHTAPNDEKFATVFEQIMSQKNISGLDLIMILGFGVFTRISSGKYIYLKDDGVCLSSLSLLIGQHMIKNNPADISKFVGCV